MSSTTGTGHPDQVRRGPWPVVDAKVLSRVAGGCERWVRTGPADVVKSRFYL